MRVRVADVYLFVGLGLYIARSAESQDISDQLINEIFLFLIQSEQCAEIGGSGPDGGLHRFISEPIECSFQQCRFPTEVCTVNADYEDHACTFLPPDCLEAVDEEFDLGITTRAPPTDATPQPTTTPLQPTTTPPMDTTTTPRTDVRTTPPPIRPGDTRDWHRDCCFWAGKGECGTNKKFMCPVCQASCQSSGCTQENYYSVPVEPLPMCVDHYGVLPPQPQPGYGSGYGVPDSAYGVSEQRIPDPVETVDSYSIPKAPTRRVEPSMYPANSYYVPSAKLPLRPAFKTEQAVVAGSFGLFAPSRRFGAPVRGFRAGTVPPNRSFGIAAQRRSATAALHPRLQLGLATFQPRIPPPPTTGARRLGVAREPFQVVQGHVRHALHASMPFQFLPVAGSGRLPETAVGWPNGGWERAQIQATAYSTATSAPWLQPESQQFASRSGYDESYTGNNVGNTNVHNPATDNGYSNIDVNDHNNGANIQSYGSGSTTVNGGFSSAQQVPYGSGAWVGPYDGLDVGRAMLPTGPRRLHLPPLPQPSPFASVWQQYGDAYSAYPAPVHPNNGAEAGTSYGNVAPSYGTEGQGPSAYGADESAGAPPRPEPPIANFKTSRFETQAWENPFPHQTWESEADSFDLPRGPIFSLRLASTTPTPSFTVPPRNKYGHPSLFADILEPEKLFTRFLPIRDASPQKQEPMQRTPPRRIFDFSTP